MKYDKPLIAVLIGALSTIPGEMATRALVFLGIGKYSIYQLDSLLITFNRPTTIIGLVVNFIVGGLIAVLLYYALNKLGEDYLVLKSVAAGLLFWFVFELIFTATVEGKFIEIRPVSDYYIHLLATIVYGITMGLLFNKYLSKRSIPL
ncbi:MAG: hypothetical protein WC601_01300 [Desulfotomaculaceae bacterium]